MLRPTVVEGDILDRDEVLRFCGVDILDRDEVLRFCGVWSEDEANHSTSVIARPNTGYQDIKFAQRSLTSQVTSQCSSVSNIGQNFKIFQFPLQVNIFFIRVSQTPVRMLVEHHVFACLEVWEMTFGTQHPRSLSQSQPLTLPV